jgi:hypothetical protein
LPARGSVARSARLWPAAKRAIERPARLINALDDGGGWYYRTVTAAIDNDGDMLEVLDVLAQDVGIGIFSDWPATVTFYANCMGLKSLASSAAAAGIRAPRLSHRSVGTGFVCLIAPSILQEFCGSWVPLVFSISAVLSVTAEIER